MDLKEQDINALAGANSTNSLEEATPRRLKLRHIAMFELDNLAYSDREKVAGIIDIANMVTHNSVPKDSLVKMVRYLLDFVVDGEWRDR